MDCIRSLTGNYFTGKHINVRQKVKSTEASYECCCSKDTLSHVHEPTIMWQVFTEYINSIRLYIYMYRKCSVNLIRLIDPSQSSRIKWHTCVFICYST